MSDRVGERGLRFWRWASVLFGGIALLKGLRVPSTWAKSQLQITYVHGFVRRGLLGEVLQRLHVRGSHPVDAFFILELLVLAGLLGVLAGQSGLMSARGNPAVVAAFAGSYAVTFLAHLIGYQDVALYVLAVGLVLVPDPAKRFWLAMPVCAMGLLIHENFLLCALPAVLFSFAADTERVGDRRAALYGGALMLVSVALTAAISVEPSLGPVALEEFKRAAVARAGYPINSRVLDVLGMSTMDNVRLNFEVLRDHWWYWAELGVAVLTMGPLLALLTWQGNVLARGRRRLLFWGASFAPLLLLGLGWDNVRWMSLCAVTTFINLCLLCRSAEIAEPSLYDERAVYASIVVLGIGLASGHGLMDGQKVNPYPFFPPAIRPAVMRHDGVVGAVL